MTIVDKHDTRHNFYVGVNTFVLRDGKLLLGKRGNITGKDQWGLPGGHLEFQESIVHAAQRELGEETGLVGNDFTLVNLTNVPQSDRHYIQIGVLAKNVQGEPQLKEPDRCQEWKWFALDGLPDMLFFGHKEQILGFTQEQLLTDTDNVIE